MLILSPAHQKSRRLSGVGGSGFCGFPSVDIEVCGAVGVVLVGTAPHNDVDAFAGITLGPGVAEKAVIFAIPGVHIAVPEFLRGFSRVRLTAGVIANSGRVRTPIVYRLSYRGIMVQRTFKTTY